MPGLARHPCLAALLLTLVAARTPASTLLQDVRVIDGTGTSPVEHADVLVDAGLIRAIGPHGHVPAPAGSERLDGAGMSVLPGLISDHSHLGQVQGTEANGSNATRANILRQLAQYEAYGVTTVMSLGLNRDIFYQLQPAIHDASLPGADLFGADRGFGAVQGGPPRAMGIDDDQVYRPGTPEAARVAVRESIGRKPTMLKLWLDDFNHTQPDKMKPEIYQAIIDEAHRHRVRVAAHIFYLQDAKSLLAAGIDVLAHGVRDRPVDAEFIRLLKDHQAWYIPTLGLDESFYLFAEQPQLLETPLLQHALQPALARQLADPAWRAKTLADAPKLEQQKQAREMNLRNLRTLYDAGAQIGFGTDSGATPLRVAGYAEHRELKLLLDAGLTPLQALTLATSNAARLLSLADRGQLTPGKRADIILVRGNPAQDLADLDHIVVVFRGGQRAASVIDSFTP